MRFGDLSRMPLHLLRFEIAGSCATCELMARDPDPWDFDLAPNTYDRNATMQALLDAMAVRRLLFHTLSSVTEVKIRVYRPPQPGRRELIITGLMTRDDIVPPRVSSTVMRAKLYGLRFSMQEGELAPLPTEEEKLHSAT